MLDELIDQFEDNHNVIKSVNAWYTEFKQYVNTNIRSADQPIPYNPLHENEFNNLLTQFLFSPNGRIRVKPLLLMFQL